MRTSGFDRQAVWFLIIFIVGSAIVFLVGLIIIRLKGLYVAPRKLEGEKAQKITKSQVKLGLFCVIFPVGGLGVPYIFECSLTECLAWLSAGFVIAIFVLAIGFWRMSKKKSLY